MTSPADLRKLARLDIARGAPIVGFTGINGAGKTLLAVQSAIHDLASGREVYSTVQITSKWGESKPIRSLRQLVELKDATVLLDEVAVIFPSSSASQSLPEEVNVMLQTLRHRGNTLRWTAPAWMRCANKLREVTQVAVNVMPMLRWGGGLWPSPRLVLAGALDTTQGKADAVPTRVLRRKAMIPRRLDAWGSYDTLADTPWIGGRSVGGVCVDCSGTQARPKHSRERHEMLGLPYYEDEPGVVAKPVPPSFVPEVLEE